MGKRAAHFADWQSWPSVKVQREEIIAMIELAVFIFLIVGIAYFVGGQQAAANALNVLGNIGCIGAVIVIALVIAFFALVLK